MTERQMTAQDSQAAYRNAMREHSLKQLRGILDMLQKERAAQVGRKRPASLLVVIHVSSTGRSFDGRGPL